MLTFAACAEWFKSIISVSTCLILSMACASCSNDDEREVTADYSKESLACMQCHDVTFDASHHIDCDQCHLPGENPDENSDAHPAVLAMPAHPDHAALTCGKCHDKQTAMVLDSDHYRLNGHINAIRTAFGIDSDTDSAAHGLLSSVSARETPENISELVDDLMSRRCLRCHVYNPGDQYSLVSHGTGCAACHIDMSDTVSVSHNFIPKPSDERCLSCHYGNHVGFDYYGRYEHDLNEEYRTPYSVDAAENPPYGIEYHQLAADIHQVAGMVCIDCHSQGQIMGTGARPDCRSCHDYRPDLELPASIKMQDGEPLFVSPATSLRLPVPQMVHEAHERYGDQFSCQVCHAQWGFNDGTVHLVRIDHEEFDDYYKLSVDGSSEVHRIIDSHISEDGDLYEPYMSDKFTGELLPGIWLRGFFERRWELLEFIEGTDGVVRTARPILDLHISWIDEDEQIRFDNIRPQSSRLQPYAPHTIGRAGMFYQTRIAPFLEQPH